MQQGEELEMGLLLLLETVYFQEKIHSSFLIDELHQQRLQLVLDVTCGVALSS